MLRNCFFGAIVCGCVLGIFQVSRADGVEKATTKREAVRTPTPIEDDAQLHDVQFINSQIGWAVGEHGVIWHTTDAGKQWQLQPSGVAFALRSVCFLTDQIGWVAGGGTVPFTHQSRGVVLHTTDGGRSWRQLPTTSVPEIYKVKFFGLKEGVIAGDPGPNSPTGLLFTSDGGRTWTGGAGMRVRGWRAGDFVNVERGLVAGPMGKVAVVTESNLNSALMSDFGLRGIYAVRFSSPERAWATGDGGLVLTTENGGVSWKSPTEPLPEEVRNTFDFRAVEVKGNKIWIVGRPGSVIWHSPDGGHHWQRQLTGQSVPLTALSFFSETDGWAVGALGTMLKTDDGGRTWVAVRGNKRRSALLTLHTRTEQVSVNLVAQLAGQWGYRSVVSLLPRFDTGPSIDESASLDARLHESVVKAGGSAGEMYWRLPLTVPGLEKNSARLWDDWMRRTENKLPEVILGHLVSEFRMWRPSIIVIDQPAADDAIGHVVLKAVQRAVKAAADPTRFSASRELNELSPWQVTKIYARLPKGSKGDAKIDPHRFLTIFRQSVHMASARAHGRLSKDHHRPAVSEAYRLVYDFGDSSARQDFPRNDFFAGLPLSPGGAARRAQVPIEDDMELERKIARLQKQSRAYREQFMDDPRHASQVVGQLNDFINGLTDAEMAVQLAELIDVYKQQGDWELAEVVAVVLVEKFPNEPAAREAMQWLFHLWVGAETTWRRAQESASSRQRISGDKQKLIAQLAKPRYSQQRKRFRQLNPQARREVASNIQTVLEATAKPDKRRPPKLQIGQIKHSQSGAQGRFPQGLAQLKLQFGELDHVADDTPQLQLAAGEEQRSPNPITQALSVQSRATKVHLRERMKSWQQQAARIAELMHAVDPALFEGPTMQFPLAALLRKRGLPNEADVIYRHFRQLGSQDPWSLSGASEIWFSVPRNNPPKAFQICWNTSQRPHLDGMLSDPCWINAQEIPLTDGSAASTADPDAPRSLAMLCYDNQFLYFAASFPRLPGAPDDMPLNEGRTHDADLSHFDRVTLTLDIDRDYATFYSFSIDQRGWTSEACWNDRTWNPKYFVSAHGDKRNWRIEVAVPWTELAPQPPGHNDVWNVGIVRTTPAVGRQSWTHPISNKPRPEVFGLVRFD